MPEPTSRSLATAELEVKLISSGENRPIVNLRAEDRDRLLLLSSSDASVEEICRTLGQDDATCARHVEELVEAGLLARAGDRLAPRVAVMTEDLVARHMPVRPGLVEAGVALVEASLEDARATVSRAEPRGAASFDDLSLLVLSDVLLDNWQIRAVEREVIGAERPARAGGHYYLALMERSAAAGTEAFGIYGNHVGSYGELLVGVYGNHRTPEHDVHAARPDLLGLPADAGREARSERIGELVRGYVEWATTGGAPDSDLAPLRRLGWIGPDGSPGAPVLSAAADDLFSDLAGRFRPDYVELLHSELPALRATYEASPYAEWITFEEYFMWWYHLFYTKVTNALIDAGHVVRPGSGNVSYVILPR